MVAHLIRLRLLILKNSLLRSPWQLVAVIVGGLYAIGLVFSATAGLAVLGTNSPDVARTTIVLAGSALLLGWLVLPALVAGFDQTLDPAQLRTFPIAPTALLLGLLLCAVLGIPGLATVFLAMATGVAWLQHPLAAVVAVVCGLLGAATCITGSRLAVTLSGAFTSGRRFREISGIVVFVPLVLAGPILGFLFEGVSWDLGDRGATLTVAADVLSWTPLGAFWAVAPDLALGSVAPAAVKFVIGTVTLGALLLGWRRALARSLVNPARTEVTRRTPGRLGFFALLPATPTGAVTARALTYWVRDPRYTRQFLTLFVGPALMVFYSTLFGSMMFFNAIAPITAFVLAVALFTDLSYDSTAFAAHLSGGVRGVADRAGRVLALATFAVPVVIVFAVVSVGMSGSWSLLPAVLGLSLGALLTGMGVSSVTSATVVVPVPAPGDNPFKTPPGAGMLNFAASSATAGVLFALTLPELVLVALQLSTGQPGYGVAALAVGLLLGTALLVLGVRRGGARLDVGGPELLQRLHRQA